MQSTKINGQPYQLATITTTRLLKYPNSNKKILNTNTSHSFHQKKISINNQIVEQRKQNYLNTQYNRRLTTLKQITKENKKIHQRINSQKSLYSQDRMNRSTDSLKSLSRCSSRSKKVNGEENSKNKDIKKKRANVSIQSKSIASINATNAEQFRSIFSRTKKNEDHKKKYLEGPRKSNRSFSIRAHSRMQVKKEAASPKPIIMGSMLHQIAEQLFVGNYQLKNKNSRRMLY